MLWRLVLGFGLGLSGRILRGSSAFIGWLLSFWFRGRDSPRRATYFLLLRQKKVSKEKATPLSATPSLRYGATCGARVSRGLAELASLKQLRALIRETLRSSAQPEGVQTNRAIASLGPQASAGAKRLQRLGIGCSVLVVGCLEPSAAKACRYLNPFWMRRGAQGFADQGSPLSERSEFGRDPAKCEHRRLPGAKRRDAASRGRLSLLTFFGEAKKVSRPPGRVPAPENKPPQTG